MGLYCTVSNTFGEYAGMYMGFGFCNGNANMAKEEYQKGYPQRWHLSTNTYRTLDQRLRETGTFISNYHNRDKPRKRRTIQLDEQILDAVYEDYDVQHKTSSPEYSYQSNSALSIISES